MENLLIDSWQIYKNVGMHSTYFKYIQITNDQTLLDNINSLSVTARDILYNQILPQLNRANRMKNENLVNRIVITIDYPWNSRFQKSRLLKEFYERNILAKCKIPKRKNCFVVNIAYFNPFNAEQTKEFIQQMAKADYLDRLES